MTTHTTLDPIIHPPKRLSIMATLCGSGLVSFRYLGDELEIADSDLSKQMATLSDAGYVKITKQGAGPRQTTWYRATPKGKKAFARHTAALRTLIDLAADD